VQSIGIAAAPKFKAPANSSQKDEVSHVRETTYTDIDSSSDRNEGGGAWDLDDDLDLLDA
jgi:hypothetical protein